MCCAAPPEALCGRHPYVALQVKRLQDLQLEGLLQPAQAAAFQQQAAAYPDMSPLDRRELCDRIMQVCDPQASPTSGAVQPSAGVSNPAVRGSSRSRQAPAAAAAGPCFPAADSNALLLPVPAIHLRYVAFNCLAGARSMLQDSASGSHPAPAGSAAAIEWQQGHEIRTAA
jgi:hypothetical protein